MFDWIESSLPDIKVLETRFDQLWPICRSLTGPGVRRSLELLQETIPLKIESVPSGTKAFDWVVPLEWTIRDAYVKNAQGKRCIDFQKNNLHVISYSTPIRQTMSLSELQNHLHSLPDQPEAIPYLTNYYSRNWGFCLSDKERQRMLDDRYEVVIDSTLAPGELNYAHLLLPSTTGSKEEIFLSTYICHPSLANNELSGPLVTTALYEALKNLPIRRFNYRFVFVPETIGALVYLAKYGAELKQNCRAGLVVTCCGDDRKITYKKSRQGNAAIDRCVEMVLCAHQRRTGKDFSVIDFFPLGSDERQYCSPGFNLPVGSLMRSMYGTYPEYHTSLDNKDFISFAAMRETVKLYLESLLSLELNAKFIGTVQHGEPMLGPRGLYPSLGSTKTNDESILKMMFVLNFSDGANDLLAIAEKAGTSVVELAKIAQQLEDKGLLIRQPRNEGAWASPP